MNTSATLPIEGVSGMAGRPPGALHLKTILVPVDFSDASREALEYAVSFARQFGARITLLHVAQAYFCASEFAYMPVEETEMHARMRRRLQTLALEKVDPELMGGTLVRDGSPFDQITKAAREIRADVIIINTHGYTGLKHILMGSTAEMVVRYAPCPVFVVRARQHECV